MSWGCTCAVNWLNSALSPVVYGDIALSINTQYNTIQYNTKKSEWVTFTDFMDTYFHMLINPQSSKYLRSYIQGQSYQYKAVPMDFTVVAEEVKLMAQNKGIRKPPVPAQLVGHTSLSPPQRSFIKNGTWSKRSVGSSTLFIGNVPVRLLMSHSR